MFEQVLSAEARTAAAQLVAMRATAPFYLAGGTGIALQLGHRISEDFDFFTTQPFSPESLLRSLVQQGETKEATQSQGTLHVQWQHLRCSFLYYPYPLLYPPHTWGKMRIADMRDGACMKLTAIADRGAKKDFIDLYAIMQQGLTLLELTHLFEKKFAPVAYNFQHYLKSLVYFVDAEEDPMPHMLVALQWDTVKTFFERLVKEA